MSVINQNKIWNTISLSVCNFQGHNHVLNTSLSFFSCRTWRGISDIHLYFSIYLLFHFHLKTIFILTRCFNFTSMIGVSSDHIVCRLCFGLQQLNESVENTKSPSFFHIQKKKMFFLPCKKLTLHFLLIRENF